MFYGRPDRDEFEDGSSSVSRILALGNIPGQKFEKHIYCDEMSNQFGEKLSKTLVLIIHRLLHSFSNQNNKLFFIIHYENLNN